MTGPAPEDRPTGPAVDAPVLRGLGLDTKPADDPDVIDARDAVDAVNALLAGYDHIRPDDAGEFRHNHRYGARLLAVRLVRRKDSPAGVVQFGLEGAAYVSRNDPDVAHLLGIGAYAKPRVG